jgi:hypothetical protein
MIGNSRRRELIQSSECQERMNLAQSFNNIRKIAGNQGGDAFSLPHDVDIKTWLILFIGGVEFDTCTGITPLVFVDGLIRPCVAKRAVYSWPLSSYAKFTVNAFP